MTLIKSFEQFLLEMSLEAKIAKRKMEDLQFEIAQHMIYVYLGKLSNNKNTEHWKSEVFAWLLKINNFQLKPNNRKLSYETYYDILFDQPLNNGIDNWVGRIIGDIENESMNINLSVKQIELLYSHLDSFYKDLCIIFTKPVKINAFNKKAFSTLIDKYLT